MNRTHDWQPLSYEAMTGEPFEYAIRALNAVDLALEIREPEPLRHAALALIAVTPAQPAQQRDILAKLFGEATDALQTSLLRLADFLDYPQCRPLLIQEQVQLSIRALRHAVGVLEIWQRSVQWAARRTEGAVQ